MSLVARFERFRTVSLKTFEGLHEVILHEILMENTDEAFFMLRDGVQAGVLRRGVLGVDRGEL